MVGLIISIAVATVVSILWVRGIDNMKQNPDYKGYDQTVYMMKTL